MSGAIIKRSRAEVLRLVQRALNMRQGDLKATVIAHQIIQNGADNNDVIVKMDNYFVRHFSREIESSEIVENDAHRPYLELRLTKAGFYDLLPEGLFFQPTQKDFRKNNQINVAEEVFNFRRDKQKEKEIRKFFQPIENELFKQEVLIEKSESDLIEYFRLPQTEIWDFPNILSEKDKISFALLLPYALEINGQITLMSKTLSLILEENVIIKKERTKVTVYPEPLTLGTSSLGTNMICGDVFWEESLILRYEIGPLKHHSIEDFLMEGKGLTLLKTFNRYFAPVDAEIEFEIMLDRDKEKATLSAGEKSVLGYSTVL